MIYIMAAEEQRMLFGALVYLLDLIGDIGNEKVLNALDLVN